MLQIYTTQDEPIRFIASQDDAVDVSTDTGREAYQAYLDHHDPSRLVMVDGQQPLVFVLRPLSRDTLGRAVRDAEGLLDPHQEIMDTPTARELLRQSCRAIEWPDDVEEPADIWMGQYQQRVLRRAFSDHLPDGACREAALMLLRTLPTEETASSLKKKSGRS
jgi:hypothetical protein